MSPNTKVVSNDNDTDTPDLVEESESSLTYEKDLLHNSGKTNDASSDEKTNIIPKQPTTPISSRLDRFLSKYGTFSSSTFTADQGIKILQWSSWAISYATTKSSNVNNISPSLRKLYNELSMARYILRFYGMLQSLEGYRSGSWAGGSWDNPLIGKIAKYIMAGSMLVYYPLEHVAYAGWQMPKLVKVNANKISAISCCFWTAYIVGDFWVSCLKWKELKMKLSDIGDILSGKKNMRKDGNTDGGDGNKEENVTELLKEETALIKKIRLIKLQLLRCLLFILPAINWSLPNWATNPLLGELPLNGLMLVEAYTSVYQSLVSMCTP